MRKTGLERKMREPGQKGDKKTGVEWKMRKTWVERKNEKDRFRKEMRKPFQKEMK